MSQEVCDSSVELSMLASGMAKQYERYQDALQELIDNAVSSKVSDERYFEQPNESVELAVILVRDRETVTTIVADNGPGISYQDLRDQVFRTGNKSRSVGILNNVGWGLKSSISWFEQTVRSADISPKDPWFTLITQRAEDEIYRVDGPVTGELPISTGTTSDWKIGLECSESKLETVPHGTRIHVDCSRQRFDSDVWPSADSIGIKAQALRERLGVIFRRLLMAHDDNAIYIGYHDLENGESDSFEVIPIEPIYRDGQGTTGTEQNSSGRHYGYDEFEVITERGTYEIEYERGMLDFDSMISRARDYDERLVTNGGNFRTRYRPSQSRQGVDVYANGRVLMTSIFTDLFSLSRNNQYNYFGGELRIIPASPAETEVPTDNKKTRIDTNSQLWQALRNQFAEADFQPIGKDYHIKKRDESAETAESTEVDLVEGTSVDTDICTPVDGDAFGLFRADARNLMSNLQHFDNETLEGGLVDLTITSPPYADLKDYGYSADAQIGLGDSYTDYLNELRKVFAQTYDVTADHGSLWVVIDTFRDNKQVVNLPADIARICQNLNRQFICHHCSTSELKVPLISPSANYPGECINCGYTAENTSSSWSLQETIVWQKGRSLPYSQPGKLRNMFEYILCFSKTNKPKFNLDRIRIADPTKFKDWWVDYPERYHPRGKVPHNVWEFLSPSQGSFGYKALDHPAPFPPALVARIIRLTSDPGDVVFDPFAGSGTVLGQAAAMKRKPLGFELSPKYCEAYPAVKDELADRWKSSSEDSSKTKIARQTSLAEIIAGLRQIKQAREVVRSIATAQQLDSPNQLDVELVIHMCDDICSGVRSEKPLAKSRVLLIVDSGTPSQRAAQIELMAEEALTKPPLSRYNLETTSSAWTLTELADTAESEKWEPINGKMYVYRNGRHYKYTSTTTLNALRVAEGGYIDSLEQNSGERDIPPIISNLGIEVHNPRYFSNSQKDNAGPVLHKICRESSNESYKPAWLSATGPLGSESD